MTQQSHKTQPGSPHTTWQRRYTLDPQFAEEFVQFLTTEVIPARESRGFSVGAVWIDTEQSQLTWYVSYPGDSEQFAAAERDWEQSEQRAEIFAGKPAYVTGKDLREVTDLN